jgi:hypothetical protein
MPSVSLSRRAQYCAMARYCAELPLAERIWSVTASRSAIKCFSRDVSRTLSMTWRDAPGLLLACVLIPFPIDSRSRSKRAVSAATVLLSCWAVLNRRSCAYVSWRILLCSVVQIAATQTLAGLSGLKVSRSNAGSRDAPFRVGGPSARRRCSTPVCPCRDALQSLFAAAATDTDDARRRHRADRKPVSFNN